MTVWELVLLTGALAFAGLVKGVTGMGLPLFATPVLAGVFGARPAVVILSIPIFVTNVLLLYEGRRILRVAGDLWTMALGGAAGVVVGVRLLVQLDQNLLALLIAALVFLLVGAGRRVFEKVPRSFDAKVLGPLVGFASGVLMGATSISGPLVGSYLHARRLTAERFVVAIAFIFQVFAVVQVIGLWRLGLYDRTTVTVGLTGLVPTLLAFWLGTRVRERLDTRAFRTVVVALLLLSAVNLLLQGLRGLGVLS
ncbi:MAG TPA: TSUP family transporter [Thermodesulfobacteriota bacterium]|nr:TSUP family transporter [Thermodesulfobacteriota bacterium]